MKLTRIIARGFKGRDFDIQLTPANILFGGNFRGKTRVMDAIRLALLGHLPELGKSNRDTFGLASGQEMEVVAEFDTGLRIRRRWTLSGNSVKSDQDVPESIKELGDMAVMLNADEYFGLSDRARVDYVFAHCSMRSALGPDDIVSRVEKLLLADHKGTLLDKFIAKLGGKEDDKHYPDGRAFIEGQIETVAQLWKDAKAAAVRAEKTIQQLTDMRLRDEPTTPITVLEQRRVKLTGELAELNERKGRVIGSFTQMKTDAQRRSTITREISFGDKNRIQLADLKDKLALVVRTLDIESPVTQEMVSATASAVEMAIQQKNEALRLKAEADTAKDTAEKRLAHLDGEDACPYCGAKGETWKAQKSADLAQEMGAAEVESAKQHKRVEELTVVVNEARNTHLLTLQQQRNQQDLLTEKSQLLMKVASLEPQVSRLETLADEAKRLMADDPNLTVQVEMLQSEINIKNEEIRQVDGEIKAVNGRAFELKRLADAEKERDDAKVEAKIAEVAGKELRVIQGEMVAEAFRPLLDRANSFFGRVLKTPLAYNAAEGGEIGTWRDGLWVGHRTFSGTEKALTYAAIQAALAMASPFRLMLVDELGRLDENSVDGVINAVCRALDEGRIDGFVGIDVSRGPFYELHASANPNLQVIEIK